ncbi:GGDEF domain-containing protein [Clostridium gelidum]|uniref:GGDEF domain-containing protein n=1 Tax=Clostridium gelidum TaxID=704125 RepID=A0ABM7T2K6_9CLOT|nr:GGDEF domain-containing protein [Clostridium gelidum]BCZ45475.1 GGDEF domain-containing protein [Clostridium gelidum]
MLNLLPTQINIVLSILLIILLGHAYFNMNRKTTTNRLFMWIMGLTCITSILEIFSVLLNNPNLKQFMVLHNLVNIIGFIVTPIIPYLAYIFIKEWVNRYQEEKIETNYILLLPLLINGIATLTSNNESGLFYITSNNTYERGALFFILPCVSYIYFVYNLYFMYKHRKKFTFSECVMFSSYYILPAVFTVIQLKNYVYLTIWNSAAIITVITYIFILNDQAYRDGMTGLGNRLAYEQYAQNINHRKQKELSIIYIDIDEFKNINDQYGHSEGDEAIKTFANLLSKSFTLRQKKLIRLGGDEFVILLEENQKEKVVSYIQNLTQNVETYNNRGEKSYRFKFSYGLVGYINANESIYQLLERADQLMYEQKKSRKSELYG